MSIDDVLSRPEVQRAIDTGDTGAIVRAVRLARGLTLSQLGKLLHLQHTTLSRKETGQIPFNDVPTLRAAATALQIPPEVLGVTDTNATYPAKPARPAKVNSSPALDPRTEPMRRRTVLTGLTGLVGSSLLGLPTGQARPAADPITALENLVLSPPQISGPAPSLQTVQQWVSRARHALQQGRYRDLGVEIPSAVLRATAARGHMPTPEQECRLEVGIAELNTITTELMIKLDLDRYGWVTTDRAIKAAYASGDLLAHASAHRAFAILTRRDQRAARAQEIVLDTAAAVEPAMDRSPQQISIYGALMATAAYTAAVDGKADDARALISEADRAAHLLGYDGNHLGTAFGPTSVQIYKVSISQVQGDYADAINHARTINRAAIGQPERVARLCLDEAKAHDGARNPVACFTALLAAEQAAPDEVRFRKPIHEITNRLLTRAGTAQLPEIRRFAARCGLHA